jgi:hypothetical protein
MWHKAIFKPLPPVLWTYAGPWLLLPILQTLVLHRLGLDWTTSILDSLISNGLLVLAAMETSLLFQYYQPGRENPFYRGIFLMASASLYTAGLWWLAPYLLPEDPAYLEFLKASLPVRGVFALLLLYFISLVTWVRKRLVEQQELERRKAESERILREAELGRLRQQLHPHFLFNSLNSITALIGKQPETARKMTRQLSDFLRSTLKKEDQLISLREELEHLDLYLSIEQVRFGERLQIRVEPSDESLEERLPALLLQPVVENAIKFGLYDLTGQVEIQLLAECQGPFLEIRVRNPYDPESPLSQAGTGFGLSSIQRRLQLLYARVDLLETQAEAGIFQTQIRIPITPE